MANKSDIRHKQTLDNSEFKKGLRNSQQQANVFKTQMKALGGVIAGAFAVGAVASFFKTSLEGLDQQQKAEAKLLTALKGRQDIQQELIKDASELQRKTLFGDETTIEAYAQLAAFIKNEEALKRLMPLVQDMATAMNMDLVSAAQLVGKSLGNSTNALKRYGIQIDGAVGSNERLESAVTSLTAKFQGQAEAAAGTALGAVKQLSNAWGDFGESLVVFVGPALTKVAKGLTGALAGLTAMQESESLSWWDKLRLSIAGATGDVEAVAKITAKNYRPEVENATEATKVFNEVIETSEEDFEAQAKAVKEAANNIRDFQAAMGIEEEKKSPQVLQSSMPLGELPGGLESTGIKSAAEDVKELNLQFKQAVDALPSYAQQFEEAAYRISAAFDAIGQAVGTAIGEFIKGEAEFSDIATNLIQEIIKIIAGYFAQSVASSFAGGASVGGPAAPFSGAAAAAAAISMFGALVPALMAKGGTIPSGFPNDTYPAMLSSGETVLPAPHALSGFQGGVQTIQVIGKIRGQDIHFINEVQTSKLSRYR